MKKLLGMFRWYEYILILINAAILMMRVLFEITLIDRMTELVGKLQIGGSVQSIRILGGKMLADSFAIMLCAILSSALVAYVASRFSQRLRANVFARVNGFSEKEMNEFGTASLITRCTNDITQIQKTMQMALKIGVLAPAMGILSIVKITQYDVTLSKITAVAMVLIFALFAITFLLTWRTSARMQTMTDRLNGLTRENLTGVRVIRAYNAEKEQEEKFEGANKDLTGIGLYTALVTGMMNPLMDFIFNALCLAVYWLGAYLIHVSALEYSNLMGFSRYGTNILTFSMLFSSLIVLLPRATASMKRVVAVLETEPSVQFGTFDGETEIRGTLEFRHVSFAYPDSKVKVLDDISFTASPGETMAFIGATGSGKSTLVNLIPRFFDPKEGEIILDGIDIRKYTREALSRKIGFVPQKSVLFSGSVRENIAYGMKEVSEEMIKRSLEIAQADFVSKLNGGLDFPVAQGGSNLSGGQKQRLCIARAVAKAPEVYIFDDSFSALDYQTDQKLRAALHENTKNATRIIVAQRVGTIMDADKIIVLENGKAIGTGTHRELLKNCAVYREIAASQLSKEELENA